MSIVRGSDPRTPFEALRYFWERQSQVKRVGTINVVVEFVKDQTTSELLDSITKKVDNLTETFITQMDEIAGKQFYHTRFHGREMSIDALLIEPVVAKFFSESGFFTETGADSDTHSRAKDLLIRLVSGMFAVHDVIQGQGKGQPSNEQKSYEKYIKQLKPILADAGIPVHSKLYKQIDRMAKVVIVHGTTFDYDNYRTPIEAYLMSIKGRSDKDIADCINDDPIVAFVSFWAAMMDTRRMAARELMQNSEIHLASAKKQKDEIKYGDKSEVNLENNSILAMLGQGVDKQLFIQCFGQNARMMFELEGKKLAEEKPLNSLLLDKVFDIIRDISPQRELSADDKLKLYDFILDKMLGEKGELRDGGFSVKMANAEKELQNVAQEFKSKFYTGVDITAGLDLNVWSKYVPAANDVMQKIQDHIDNPDPLGKRKQHRIFEFVDDFIMIAKSQQGKYMQAAPELHNNITIRSKL